jgi:hypothetical protein
MRAVRFRPSEINQWIDNGGLNAGGENGFETDGGLLGETDGARLEVEETGGEK